MSANNAIGVGSLILTANADPLTRKLQELEGKIHAWGKGLKAKGSGGQAAGEAFTHGFIGSVTGGIRSIAPFIGGAIGGAVGGPIGAVIGGAVGDALGAIPAKIGEFAAKVAETVREVAKEGEAAKAFGVSPEAFTGMSALAKSVGEGSREFIESLVTLQKVGSDAVLGKGEEAAEFFRRLNVDAKEFAKLPINEQFFKFFEAAQKIPNATERMRLAMIAFGEDGGKYLFPLLNKAPADLRKMAAASAMSAAEMARATKSAEALNRLNAVGDVLWKKTAIAVSPLLEGGARMLTPLLERLAPVAEWLGRALGRVGDLGGLAFEKVAAWAGAAADAVLKAQQAVGVFGDKWVTVEDLITAGFLVIGKAGAYTFDTLNAACAALTLTFGKMIDSGITPVAKALAAIGVISDETAARVERLGVDTIKRSIKVIADWGKTAADLERAIIGIKPGKPPDPVPKKPDAPVVAPAKLAFPEAVLRGSKDAYSLELRNRFGADFKRGDKAVDEAKKANKNLEKGNQQHKKNGMHLAAIERQLESIGVF